MTDTIFALATAPGRAAVAVVRLSGSGVREALRGLGARVPVPRRASLRTLTDRRGEILDRGLVVWFPGPESYTGEDCAELHVHGGLAVVEGVMAALAALDLRLAEPGEFTRRAFENGKLDLGQAEAVADLVDAESAGQARQAIGQLGGALGSRYRGWRETLVSVLADLEAAVDFPDEEIPADVVNRTGEPLRRLGQALEEALLDGRRGRRVRDGYRVAIMGAPNAGKSSLFNDLVGREAAIVTPLAGTTRDVIEAGLVIGGYRLILGDMAGLRVTTDAIEGEGVRRALAWIETADLRLWVVDRSSDDESWRMGSDLVRQGDLCVLNKNDLPAGAAAPGARDAAGGLGIETLEVSVGTAGAAGARDWLAARLRADLAGTDFPATTRLRHARWLETARRHVAAALESLDRPELAAEDVRLAARALAQVTGAIGAEDVLDKVFGSFCIGK